jgi:hypothetical protein
MAEFMAEPGQDADGDHFTAPACAWLPIRRCPSTGLAGANRPVTRIASWDSIVPAKPLAPVPDTNFYTFRAPDASAAIAKTFARVPVAADFDLKSARMMLHLRNPHPICKSGLQDCIQIV